MKNTFHTKNNNQVKIFNNKIKANLPEYYFLEDLEELGKIKSFNTNSAYINEKYHIKIKYMARNKKIYNKVYPRENFRDKYIFIKIENKLNSTNLKSMKFVLLYDNYIKMNESSLLKKIANSKYVEQIKNNINVDFNNRNIKYIFPSLQVGVGYIISIIDYFQYYNFFKLV